MNYKSGDIVRVRLDEDDIERLKLGREAFITDSQIITDECCHLYVKATEVYDDKVVVGKSQCIKCEKLKRDLLAEALVLVNIKPNIAEAYADRALRLIIEYLRGRE